ncbi:MAG: hypothetical protein IE933_08780 [Sphingomonadales bacterium]|nr:hypothetical protein [Sphingomonadales bacterium]MBD3773287.1 hypothetical protein [Paracoccaceae bacterium]
MHAPGQAELGQAGVVLRFYAPPGFTGGGHTWTTARRIAGNWFFRREDVAVGAPPPVPPPPPQDPSSTELVMEGPPPVIDLRSKGGREQMLVREGQLAPDRAAQLDEALADPCQALEPDSAPAFLPLKGGQGKPCYDGPPFFLQVETADRLRTYVHVCETRWRTGQIMRVLESAAAADGEGTSHMELTPEVVADESGRIITDPAVLDRPPLKLTFDGDVAGRPFMLRMRYQRLRNIDDGPLPGPTTFAYLPPIGATPGSMELVIDGCPDRLSFDVPKGDGILTISGCEAVFKPAD